MMRRLPLTEVRHWWTDFNSPGHWGEDRRNRPPTDPKIAIPGW